jgi:peptidoglycan/LPS O-acetylase OafA/YrhL
MPVSEPDRVAALDGVRGLAILFVLLFHLTHFGALPLAYADNPALGPLVVPLLGGWAGVDLFFVLSGYLITSILLKAKDKPGYFRTFYRRRILRIFPAYYVALGVCTLLVAGPIGADDLSAGGLAALAGYAVNWRIALLGWSSVPQALHHFWSLAIEEQFYLVWPFAVAWLKPRQALLVGALMGVGSLLLRLELVTTPYALNAYVATFARLDGLGAGALLAFLAARDRMPTRAVLGLAAALGAAGVAIVVLNAGLFWSGEPVWAPTLGVTSATLLSFALVGASLPRKDGAQGPRWLSNRVLRFFGRYSYSLYLWHCPVIIAMRRAQFPQSMLPPGTGLLTVSLIWFATGAAASLALALASYHGVEVFFIRLKDRPARGLSASAEAPAARSR